MSKEQLLAILVEIEKSLNMIDAQLAIFQLVKDESINKVADDVKSRLSTILNIEIEDLKEYMSQL